MKPGVDYFMDFIPYSKDEHKEQLYELNYEYVGWVAEQYYQMRNINLEDVYGKSNREYVRDFLQDFVEISPPNGIIYVIADEGNVVGMGAVVKLSEGVGEIKRMFVRSTYRGQGLGRRMLANLIEKGKEFGFSRLRLETADFFEAAVHLYRSTGFKDIDAYSGGEVSHSLRDTVRYMELDLRFT